MSREKTLHQKRVEHFMRMAGQAVPNEPTMPSDDVRRLRAELVIEEAFETAKALGFEVCTSLDPETGETSYVLTDVHPPSLVEAVDGFCDTIVVALGGLSALGVSDVGPMEEVCDSNDSKFIDGYRRGDGKWIKGPSYRPANLVAVLDGQLRSGLSPFVE